MQLGGGPCAGEDNTLMQVLVISCSPRENGNTELLLKEASRGASDAGANVEFVRLQEFNIEPCRECRLCHRDGKCVVKDDMQNLYPKLINLDTMILGSPIFFMGVPAHAKAFIDRCQPFWVMKYQLKQKFIPEEKLPRKGAFISVGGTRLNRLFDGAVRVVKSFFIVNEIEYHDEILLEGTDKKGGILEHPEGLKRSYELGNRIVKCAARGQ